MSGGELRLHASCVAAAGPDGPAALLVTGASGAGKSSLALEMISRGAALVADDQTLLRRSGEALTARAPAALFGLIEARGVGLLRLPALTDAAVVAVADLSATEDERLPPMREIDLLGLVRPRILCRGNEHAAAALLALLRAGGARRAP